MTCEELRRTVGTTGLLKPAAEEHLAGCPACFGWLEQADPLLRAFQEARPPDVAPSQASAGRVLDRWQPAAPPLSAHPLLGLVSAAVLAAAFACAVMILSAAAGSHLGDLPGLLARALGPLTAPLSTPGGVVSGLLLDYPGLMGGLVALAIAGAWAWTRIDRRLRTGPRGTG